MPLNRKSKHLPRSSRKAEPRRRRTARRVPLSPEREREIIAIAHDVLLEHGFSDFTMDAVARRARCSKRTLYQRWRHKGDFILNIIADDKPDAVVIDTGSLRGDLQALIRAIDAGFARLGKLFLGIAHAVQTDPSMAAAWRRHGFRVGKLSLEAIIQRALDRGELTRRPNVAVLHSLIPGTLVWRTYVERAGSIAAFSDELLDHVLLPLLRSY